MSQSEKAQLYALLKDAGVPMDQHYRNYTTDDLREAAEKLRAAGFERVEYIELRDAETLMPSDDPRRPRRMLAAAWLDGVRLIDNIPV